MFSACYYFSYKNALNDFNKKAVERNNDLVLSLKDRNEQNNNQQSADNSNANQLSESTNKDIENIVDNNGILEQENESKSVDVDTIKEDTTLPTTMCKLQTYDLVTGKMDEEATSIPEYLVGLTREEVIEYLHDYMQDMDWSEYEKGLQSYELQYFSKDSVVLRKVYNSKMLEYKYFLKSQNGFIVVYYSDQKTVCQYPLISVEKLTQYEKLQLEEGIFIKDDDALYSALENYSS